MYKESLKLFRTFPNLFGLEVDTIKNKFLGVISSEARRMARLVNDLLTLSKYDSKQSDAEKTEFFRCIHS